MYLLDSCVCAEFLRGNLPFTRKMLERSDPSLFGIPAVAAAELFFGVEHSRDKQRNRFLTESFLSPFAIVPFDGRCAMAYGRIREQLASQGMTIGPNDLLIAATAVANEATLVTRNEREFKRVKGLRIEVWDEVPLP